MNETSNYVAAKPTTRQLSPQEIQQYTSGPAIQVEQAFTAQEGADERTSGKDRSVALIIRLIPFSVVWLLLAAGVVWKMNLERSDAILIFGVLTAFTYYVMDKSERYDSRHGVEHHRIDSATYLAERKLDADEAIRKQLVGAYLKQLEGPRDDKQRR